MGNFSNWHFDAIEFDLELGFEGFEFPEFVFSILETQPFSVTHYDGYELPDFAELYKLGLAPDGYTPDNGTSAAVKDGRLFVDIPGDTSTTATAVINGSVSDTLEVSGDQDWFEITLIADQRYSFALDGTGGSALSDPLVRLLDASGVQIATNDDAGPGLNSLLTFTAVTTGTYYISAQAYSTQIGDYTLTVNELDSMAERTIDGIANFLTDEFFTRQSYNTGGGGATTINFSFASGAASLSAGAEALARRALDSWASVANINFVEGVGDIVFRNDAGGAFNSNFRSGGTILSSDLNVSSTWNGGNLNVDSYTYQTFLHEIGHALGLGHAGPYNGSATYGIDNVYLNDSWAYTLMSYMSQNDGAYFGDFRFVLGPQISDILALQDLYGANTTTRGGDTVYGFNSTEIDVHDFSQFTRAPSLSIFDTGGTDTLDFSGYSANARIDLNAEAFSDVDNIRGVISIARDSIIENAIGGAGADNITGNAVSNELTGGAGNDILDGGDGIDYALYSGAAFANYTITVNGDGTITVTDNVGTDGTDTLSNIEFVRMGGVDYAVGATALTPNADIYTGTSGIDVINGLAGADTLSGFGGADILHGNDGDDILNGGAGNDFLFGDAGVDRLFGGSGDDILDGGDGNDSRLDGGAGNDTINGGLGDDRLYGQLGDDTVNGGEGDDFVSGSDGVDTLNGDGGDDLLIGGNGNDIMDGGTGIDRLAGGAGDDNLVGGEGNDRLFGQADNDTVSGGNGDDFVSGELGDDNLSGNAGADRLFGSAGNDTLSGGDGDDLLNGGAGIDRIDGGDGADKLTGGSGADVFAFDLASAVTALDTIFDFATGTDMIEISGGLVYTDLTFTLSPNGQHTTISYNGHEIYVRNTTPAQLDAAQFTFISVAEELDTSKLVVSEDISVSDKPIISDVLSVTEKAVISDDDSFSFAEKNVISDDISTVSTDFGDFVITQEILAEFLAEATILRDIYINAEGVDKIGHEADVDMAYFTDMFNFI